MNFIIKPGEPDFYDDAQFERKPHGTIIVDGKECAHSMMCPHCGIHFISRKGSGNRRTYCMMCNAVTCGNPNCDACLPYEKRLDMMEKFARSFS